MVQILLGVYLISSLDFFPNPSSKFSLVQTISEHMEQRKGMNLKNLTEGLSIPTNKLNLDGNEKTGEDGESLLRDIEDYGSIRNHSASDLQETENRSIAHLHVIMSYSLDSNGRPQLLDSFLTDESVSQQ
eukprot:CAMPEP_0197251450 /NCGR_PEP_ID=MMETSP1429-20130617/57204_1 /TAXON_ID=49237 /ORGANISM="Chaetoceros  sp., Strain UNC1202" /LENGTH=129 /DNA_ID=CAMNT_0042713531 /DNA_START=351 /DNA_END=740 /DNA_ORIENTATION=-